METNKKQSLKTTRKASFVLKKNTLDNSNPPFPFAYTALKQRVFFLNSKLN